MHNLCILVHMISHICARQADSHGLTHSLSLQEVLAMKVSIWSWWPAYQVIDCPILTNLSRSCCET